MGKGFIIMVVIFAILGLGYYLFFYSPAAPSETATTEPTTEAAVTDEEIAIDESGSSAAATDAETATSEAAEEIGAADNLEVPDVE